MASKKRCNTLFETKVIWAFTGSDSDLDLEPRKLTKNELKSNLSLPVEKLLSPQASLDNDTSDGRPHSAPLVTLPQGTNMETGPADAIRWASESEKHRSKALYVEYLGPTGVDLAGVQTTPSPWEDMPGQTGEWLVVGSDYNANHYSCTGAAGIMT